MGGEGAPTMVVEGLDLALESLSGINFIVFGDEAQLKPLVAASSRLEGHITIVHTTDVVQDADKVAQAMRGGRESSMRKAINAVGTGDAAGIVSAGNTGALMAMAKFVLKTLPGIDRPAISTFFPTQRGASVMLDLGANVECGAHNLVQFAVMGEAFARVVLGLERPTIGILNVGSEDQKGGQAVRDAARILQESKDLPADFKGFIEGTDIGLGTVDVIVTDGFTGNVALKTAEGIAHLFGHFLRESLQSSVLSKIGAVLAKPALNRFKVKMDPRRYNGAMFLGLNGICIKSHGSTDAFGFSNAVKVAANLIQSGINEDIKVHFQRIAKLDAEALAAADETTKAPES